MKTDVFFKRGLLLFSAAVLMSGMAFADAAATYKAKCAMCHGADGKADTPVGKKMGAHDFSSPEVQQMSDSDLIAVTTKGKGKMPAYENKLSAADIKDVVAYVRQLGKSK